MPHYFSSDPAPFHRELIDLITTRTEPVKPVVVAAPRGFAKSTVVTFCYAMHQALFKLRHFIVLGSDTADLASDLTAYLHLELCNNQRLAADFGRGEPLADEHGAVDDFVTSGDVRFLARGRGQRIRGIKHHQHRPDLVILDDLENDKNVKNPRIVRDLLDWLTEAVYPAIAPAGSLFWVGTILAKKSALAIAIGGQKEPFDQWTRRKYQALNTDRQGGLYSLWPSRHPVEALLEQKRLMGSLAFNKEKQNDPVDEEGAFREPWIEKHAFKLDDIPPRVHRVAAWLDPSLSERKTADPRAIVAVAAPPDGRLYVVAAHISRKSLDSVIRTAFAMHKIWWFAAFGVEGNLFQERLVKDFQRLGRTLGQMPVRGVKNTLNKESRIEVLSPLVENGLLRFPRREDRDEHMNTLIEQLISFPNGDHDDGPDALEGAVRLLRFGANPGCVVG